MIDTFRYFIRKNYPEIGHASNEDLDIMGEKFHEYLNEKLSDEQRDLILPKSSVDVIMNGNHPLRINGFKPAYLVHFSEWIKFVMNDLI